MAVETSRRDFIGMAFGGFAAAGGVVALGAMKKTWDPLPSVNLLDSSLLISLQ